MDARCRTRCRATGLAFLLFLPTSGTTGKAVPALLVVAIMAMFAISELLISPIGLFVTTKLAPEAFRAQMMALYFFSVGLGASMSGVLARYCDSAHEFAYFGIICAVAILAGAIILAIAPWISRLVEASTSDLPKLTWPSRDLAEIELRINQGEHGNQIACTRV